MDDPSLREEPNVWHNVRQELAQGRQWVDRAIILGYATLAGLSVVAFTWLTDRTFGLFSRLYAAWPLALLVWTPLCTVAVAWCTRRWFPRAGGSGIPQVMVALEPDLTPSQRTSFVSLRLSVAKILLSAAGLLGGLSIGREGPSVQVAAGVMLHARRWLRKDSELGVHALLVAGGAAGLAATFNAPLAGVVFALEELGRKLPPRNSSLIIVVIVLAGLVGITFFGNQHFLGTIVVPPISLSMLGPGIGVTLASGLLGGLFARVMTASLNGAPSPLNALRRRYPLPFAAFLGLLIAGIGLATQGATFGGGAESVRNMLTQTERPSFLFVPLKFLATWLTAWSGVPGGIFAPSLAVGAGVGYDVAYYSQNMTILAPLIALGMAAFLAAVTQAPLTAFIIVMEMVDGGAMVLSLMAAAMVAAMLSRLISRPLYPALAGAMYLSLQPAYVVRDSREDNSHVLQSAPEAPSDIAPEAAPGSSAAPSSSPAEASADPSVPLPNTAAVQPPASTAPPEGSTSEDADTAGAAGDSAPK